MTTKSQIVKQLNKTGLLAYKHRMELNKLNEMIREVYGVNYNDVDCDPIIDVCEQYGGDWVGGVEALDEALHGYSGVERPM